MDKVINSLQDYIKDFLSDYNLVDPESIYIVAFSGGYDSMCLLDCLKKVCRNRIIAVHLNHNWRGEESSKEEKNCREFCNKIGVEFYSEKLSDDIAHTETEARKARYKFFEECAERFHSRVIFTAHNKNDQAETLIFRICHGTGVKGLCGISPVRDIYYRPLLKVERKDIEKYCSEHNLTPNNDSSNKDTIHFRNLIRSEILPLMNKINPDVISAIASLAEIACEETEIIKECTFFDGKIKTKDFLSMPEALQKRLLYEAITPLVPQNYDRERILTIWDFIRENCNSKSGKTVSVTKDYWFFVSDKFIELIKKTEKKDINIHINKTGVYNYDGIIVNICKCNGFSYENSGVSGESVFVDFSDIDFNFEFRNRRAGDIIRPVGLNGTQKLKKYLNEKKIPNHEKDNLMFLAQGKEILWAVGMGISDKIKVKTEPTHVIIVKKE